MYCCCFSSLLLGLELLDSLLADGADVGHVTEVFVEVQGVPDHKLVGDLEGDVVWGVAVALKKKYILLCLSRLV